MLMTYFSQDNDTQELKTITKEYPMGTQWPVILHDYVDFLSFCYGYDIKPRVSEVFEEWSDNEDSSNS